MHQEFQLLKALNMKLMQAMAGAAHGGAENFFTRLAPALQKTAIEQRVIIRRNEQRKAALISGGVEPVEMKFGGRLDWLTRRGLKREIKTFKPDIVMTWMNRATSMCHKRKPNDFVHVARLGGYYDLEYYRHCDHLIGNTQQIVDYLVEQGWDKNRAHYVPNFVNREAVTPLSRKEFTTPERVPLIVAFGRLHENKGFDVLIQALERVPDAYLWLAGTGPLREELEAVAVKAGVRPRVRFPGWRDDTTALLEAADLFVCPSRHEPLGNVVIEAWAQNTPVVATRSHGPEMLIGNQGVLSMQHQARAGILTEVDNVRELSTGINAVLNDADLYDELVQGGMEAFEADYTEQIVIAKYLEFFEKITD